MEGYVGVTRCSMEIHPRAQALLVELLRQHPGRAVRITRCKGG